MGKITRQELSTGVQSELDKTGDLTQLSTTEKSSLVGAVSEVDNELDTHTQIISSENDYGHIRLSDIHNPIIYGTYTGDGTQPRTISLGFTPKLVLVYILEASGNYNLGSVTFIGDNISIWIYDDAYVDKKLDKIITDGFEIATDRINANGNVYSYIAFK